MEGLFIKKTAAALEMWPLLFFNCPDGTPAFPGPFGSQGQQGAV